MKAPDKPYRLPNLGPGEYYESPLLAWVMIDAYNKGKVPWEEVESHLKKGVLYTTGIHRKDTENFAVREAKCIRWFSQQMADKLRGNTHKGGWQDVGIWYLYHRLLNEIDELKHALTDAEVRPGDLTLELRQEIIEECADVANFAMMVADRIQEEQ